MAKKITPKKIASNILHYSEVCREEDFIACTVEIDERAECSHSGILICYDGEISYFHFTGREVILNNDIPDFLYFKRLDIIDEGLICTFLWHCQKLAKEAKPTFGYVFDGSYYDTEGEYYLKNGKKDITTCVGFCLKTLDGFLKDKYLDISDWNLSSLDSLGKGKDRALEEAKTSGSSIFSKSIFITLSPTKI